jgi:hypothetical protein
MDVHYAFNSVSQSTIFLRLQSTQLLKSTFSICLTILCMPIPIVFFSSFPKWGFHNHFVKVRYTTRGSIGKSIVYSGSPLPYNNSPPYLCFPFVGRWYAYSRYYIRCGSCFFIIIARIFSIKAFRSVNEMCNLVSTWVGPLYITFFLISYSWFEFSNFGHTDGIQIICWVVCGWGSSWWSWDDI